MKVSNKDGYEKMQEKMYGQEQQDKVFFKVFDSGSSKERSPEGPNAKKSIF